MFSNSRSIRSPFLARKRIAHTAIAPGLKPGRLAVPIAVAAVTVASTLTLGACGGPSARDYALVQAENSKLAARVKELEAQVDELEHGASRTLGTLKAAYERGDMDAVVALAEDLNERHPGSPESRAASPLLRKAKAKLADEEKRRQAEEQARLAEATKSARERARDIVRIRRIWTSTPNSANGVDLHIVAINTSKKTIKYARFLLTAYNAVGDPAEDEIRGTSKFSGKVVGPIPPGEVITKGGYWDNAWYNPSIVKAVLTGVTIEYMDGSSVELMRQDELDYIQY